MAKALWARSCPDWARRRLNLQGCGTLHVIDMLPLSSRRFSAQRDDSLDDPARLAQHERECYGKIVRKDWIQGIRLCLDLKKEKRRIERSIIFSECETTFVLLVILASRCLVLLLLRSMLTV